MIKCKLCEFSSPNSILSHIRTAHKISAKEYKKKFPNDRLRRSWMDDNEEALESFKQVGRDNTKKMSGKAGHNKLASSVWSRNYSKCVVCFSTECKHASNGICKKCFALKQQNKITHRKNVDLSKSGVEGVDFVICKECNLPFECLMTNGHLKTHNLTEKEYQNLYGQDSTRPIKLIKRTGKSISIARHKLMEERGYLNSQEMRENKRIAMSGYMSTCNRSSVSSIEDIVSEWFLSKGFDVRFYSNSEQECQTDKTIVYRQFPLMRKYVADFAMPSCKLIIEVLGTFWHGWDFISGKKDFSELSEAAKKNVCNDKVRFEELSESGWSCVKLWEHDIKQNNLDSILLDKLPNQTQYCLTNYESEYICAKPILNSPRKLYNFRWYAGQNNVTILPSLLVTRKEFSILSPLVLESGNEKAIPNDIIMKYFTKIRSEGFPYYKMSSDLMSKKLIALMNSKSSQKIEKKYTWDGFATDLASVFHPHMFECRKKNKMTPLDFFNNDDLLKEAIYKVLCLYGIANSSKIREICRNDYKSSRINNFPPKVAITVANVLLKDNINMSTVLDPCAGFGGRLLGFASSNVKQYTCIDLSQRTCNCLENEKKFLLSNNIKSEIKIIHGECVDEMKKMIVGNKKFDLVMTSPPFKDKEEYIGVPFYQDEEEWENNFVKPFLKNSFDLLKDNGFLALYLGKTENNIDKLPKIFDEVAKSIGFVTCDQIEFTSAVSESSRGKNSTRKTFISVWKKGS